MCDAATSAETPCTVFKAGPCAIAGIARGLLAALLILASAAFTQPASATSHGPTGLEEVSYAHGLLSVDVLDAPLGEVLESVAEAAGIELSLRAAAEERLTLSFTGLPLDAGLRRILGGRTTVMLYGEGAERDRLVEVRVYGSARPSDPMAGTFEHLHVALNSPESGARMRAIDAVEHYESPAAIDMLADALRRDADAAVRAHAATALASIGGDDVVPALEAGLGDRAVQVRAEVVRGLGMVGGENATLAIAQTLFASGEPELRAVAVEALAAQGTEQARLFLEAALEDDDEAVREQARLALQR